MYENKYVLVGGIEFLHWFPAKNGWSCGSAPAALARRAISHLSTLGNDDRELGFVVGTSRNILLGFVRTFMLETSQSFLKVVKTWFP